MSDLIRDYGESNGNNPKAYDIRIECVDEFGNYQEMRTRSDWYHEMGSLVELGRMFNLFLKQLTYPRNNDLIFMEDITEDEYEFLDSALGDYRSRNDGEAVEE